MRRPGHASVTSTSDVEDGWKQNNLAQSQQSPVGGHLDVIPVDRWAKQKWPHLMLCVKLKSTACLHSINRYRNTAVCNGKQQNLTILLTDDMEGLKIILSYGCIFQCLQKVLNNFKTKSKIMALTCDLPTTKRAAVHFMCGTMGSSLYDRGAD